MCRGLRGQVQSLGLYALAPHRVAAASRSSQAHDARLAPRYTALHPLCYHGCILGGGPM